MAKKNFGSMLKGNVQNSASDAMKKIESSINGFEKIIPWEEMRPSEDNQYESPRSKVEEIKESLRKWKLLFYNLIVIPIDEDQYKYKILAGETRHTAIGELLEEGDTTFKVGIRCIVISKDTPIVDQKIIIEETNLVQRDYDPQTKSAAIIRLKALYQEKNALNGTDISVTKQIAEQTKIGERQVQKYLSTEKLIPELKAYFDSSELPLEKASQFANMDEEGQKIVVEFLKNNKDANKKEIEKIREAMKKKEEELLGKITSLEDKVQAADEENQQLKNNLDIKDKKISENEKREEELRHEIAEELKTASPDQDKIKTLQEESDRLQKEKSDIKKDRDELSKKLQETEKKIKELKEILVESEKKVAADNKKELLKEEQDKLKQEFELDTIAEQIKKNLAQLQVKGDKYKKAYGGETIAEYYTEIKNRIETDMKKILKGGE